MKFKAGAMVGDLSGSIGSTTASRNKFGSYFRQKVVPVNPNTTRQQTMRGIFATLVNNWTSTLTQPERDDWTNWANNTTINGSDGQPINITGQNAYIRFNTVRLQIGETRVDIAPTTFSNGTPPTSFITLLGSLPDQIGEVSAVMSTKILIAGLAADDGDMVLWLGAPVNTSRKFFKGPYQFSSSEAVTALDADVDFTTDVINQNQAIGLVANQFRSIKLRMCYDDGRLSEKFEALANVDADTI